MSEFTAVVEGRQVRVTTDELGSGLYDEAVCHAVRAVGLESAARFRAIRVRVWAESLLPDYGPYTYRVKNVDGELLTYGENPRFDHAHDLYRAGDPVGALVWTANKVRGAT